MTHMDEALLRAFPLLAASVSGEQQPAADFGTRYLVGRHGVSREITLPWIRFCRLIAPSALALPYGVVEDAVEFRCGPIPVAVIHEFVADAKQAQPRSLCVSVDRRRGLLRPSHRKSIVRRGTREGRPFGRPSQFRNALVDQVRSN